MKCWFKRYLPTKTALSQYRSLQVLHHYVSHPKLWRWQRESVAKATAVGLFCAFIPLPMQTLLAATFSILFTANLPVAIALVWVSNPVTMPLFLTMCYAVGCWLLQRPVQFSGTTLTEHVLAIWQPFMLGTIVVATVVALLGYVLVLLGWQLCLTKK